MNVVVISVDNEHCVVTLFRITDLVNSIHLVVVTTVGVEGSQLHPPLTQLLCRVLKEPTDVRPHVGYPEQVKLKHACQVMHTIQLCS